MVQYFKRFLIFAVYFAVLITLMFIVLFYVKGYNDEGELINYLSTLLQKKFILFYVGMVAIYPLFAFINVKRHLNKEYAYYSEAVERVMEQSGYIKLNETDTHITFRKEKMGARLALMFLDEISINKSDNPVVISGLRKEVRKLNRMLDTALL